MAITRYVLRADSQTDRLEDVEEWDSKDVDLEAYGLVLSTTTSRRIIPWHRVHEVIQKR
jgi:hypothetical protein